MPELNSLKLKKLKPNPSQLLFWFKYLLTVFVASSTFTSSLDGKLTPEEIENAGIVLGVWAVHSPVRKKKTDDQDEKP